MQPKLNKRPCQICKQIFQKERLLQFVCSLNCGIKYAHAKDMKNKAAEAKIKRREYKVAKEKQKSLTDHLNEAQDVFNRYIRMRDQAAGYGCVSCGTKKPDIQYAAGHFRTRKAAPHLRFNEDNVWLQCNRYCNSGLSGNITEYRIELVKRIGLERVEALEHSNEIKRWTKEDADAIKTKYRLLIKQLKEGKQQCQD